MKFSVIIPTFHRNDLLEQCLLKLAPENQIIPSNSYEVIVTDDGKSHTAEQLIKEKFNWVRWVKGLGTGPASNRNNGAKYAKGDFLVFTDDDCLPDPQWLFAYEEAIKMHPEVKIFEGRTYPERLKKRVDEVAPINEKGGQMPSCNFLISRDLYWELGGFDADYAFSCEDMDFHYRIKKNQNEIFFVPNASVCHPWRKVNKKLSARYHKNQLSGIQTFIFKHPEIIKTLNSKHYLFSTITALYNIIPGLISFNGRGFHYAINDLLFKFKITVFLMPLTGSFYFQRISTYLKRKI